MTIWDLAAVLACALGVRSAVVWMRRSAGTTAEARPALFSLFLAARVLLWLTLAAWFVLMGHGADSPTLAARRFWWIPGVFFVFMTAQSAAAYFLGSNRDPGPRS
jgi:hypothetical protein